MYVNYVIALPTTNHTSYFALIVIMYDRGSSTLLVSSHMGEYVGSSTLGADMLQHDAVLFTSNAGLHTSNVGLITTNAELLK